MKKAKANRSLKRAKAPTRDPVDAALALVVGMSPEHQRALLARLAPAKRAAEPQPRRVAGTQPRAGVRAERLITFKVTVEEEELVKEAARDNPRGVSGYVRDHLPCLNVPR